jgi:asparagine synthase (glutamine-hydrolysing)
MCGVCGMAGGSERERISFVTASTETLSHRGPDAVGIKVLDGAVLGHTRLRILDLSEAADQPMSCRNGTLWCSYNGEVYNFHDLHRELSAAGHRFETSSDTEVVLRGFDEWGTRVFSRLRGMFAVAVWDNRTRTLVVARDGLGIKPMYYRPLADSVAFASELRGLRRSGDRLDALSVSRYLRLGWVPGPRTIVEGIFELLPGNLLRWQAGRTTVESWTVPEPNSPSGTSASEVAEAMAEAVAVHLVSDVPLGVFLSAGVDSALVATLAARAGGRLRSFTVGFPGPKDETPAAAALARRLGLPHDTVPVSGQEVTGSIDRIVADLDQPSVDGVNSWVISKAVREAGITVALSGLGGDEIFGSYSTFWHVPRLARLGAAARHAPPKLREGLPFLAAALPGFAHSRQRRALEAVAKGGSNAAYAAVRGPLGEGDLEWLRGAPTEQVDLGIVESEDVGELEVSNYLPFQLLRDTDAMSMAHSLEIRVPLLDSTVVSLADALRRSHPAAPGGVKPLVAVAVDPQLKEVALRPKATFTLPFDRWLREELADWSAEAITAVSHQGLGLRTDRLETFRRGFLAGHVNWRAVWVLAVLGCWINEAGLG